MVDELCSESYLLALSHDLTWNLESTLSTTGWLKRFARIMGLQAGRQDHCPNIKFIRGTIGGNDLGRPAGPLDSLMLSRLSAEGWQARHLTVIRMWSRPDRADRVCELANTSTNDIELLMMWQSLHAIQEKAIYRGGMPLHAALLEFRGTGVLLVGSHDRGKSTCCRRISPPWKVLCDDETLVVGGPDGSYVAHPFPTWHDHLARGRTSSWNVQRRVPLAMILYLEQSKVDGIVPVGCGVASTWICRSSEEVFVRQMGLLPEQVRRSWRRSIFENACTIAARLPVFILRVSLTGQFWRHMERILDESCGERRCP